MNALRQVLFIVLLAAAAQPRADTTVFAAASLMSVLDEIVAAYERETGADVSVSYAASSVLARQIEAGAPAQLFISADEDWMNYLYRRGHVGGVPRTLAGNRLVLIAPADSTLSLAVGTGMNLAGRLGGERMAIADPESVPAGKYAREALEYFGEWQALAGRLLPLDNVRAALIAVQEREAPLGIVYATDARANSRVRVVGMFPETSHRAIVYPAALVSANADAGAEALLAFLQAGAARTAFTKYGFQVDGGGR